MYIYIYIYINICMYIYIESKKKERKGSGEAMGATGGSPPKFSYSKCKYKKFGGKHPLPPIASLIYTRECVVYWYLIQ